jgi:acetyl-CoA acetyltransferase
VLVSPAPGVPGRLPFWKGDSPPRPLELGRAFGAFVREITPVTVSGRGGDTVIDTDEQPGKARPEKIPGLKPAFVKDGTITAANASSISDGAGALVMAGPPGARPNSDAALKKRSLCPCKAAKRSK